MEWKTIKNDGHPKLGSLVLCRIKHDKNAWSDYHVYKFVKHQPFNEGHFFLYDLFIPDEDILEYCIIDNQNKTA